MSKFQVPSHFHSLFLHRTFVAGLHLTHWNNYWTSIPFPLVVHREMHCWSFGAEVALIRGSEVTSTSTTLHAPISLQQEKLDAEVSAFVGQSRPQLSYNLIDQITTFWPLIWLVKHKRIIIDMSSGVLPGVTVSKLRGQSIAAHKFIFRISYRWQDTPVPYSTREASIFSFLQYISGSSLPSRQEPILCTWQCTFLNCKRNCVRIPRSLCNMSDSKASSITAALGSVIGYLGGEVSQSCQFERQLWPERYYYYTDVLGCMKMIFLLPMGGPIHRAALETLDGFLRQGLYKGKVRGDMLGTAFFSEWKDIAHYHRTASNEEERKKVRNGFWSEVLKHTNSTHRERTQFGQLNREKQDQIPVYRTAYTIYILKIRCLEPSPDIARNERTYKILERKATFQGFIGIVMSESSALAVAVSTGAWLHNYWLTSYLCIPLALRILALIFSVRREPLQVPGHQKSSGTKHPSLVRNDQGTGDVQLNPYKAIDPHRQTFALCRSERQSELQTILELDIPNNGFALITSTYTLDNAILQFFCHYGNPIRHPAFDRVRETISMATVWAFVLYLAAGLITSVWMDSKA